MQMQCHHFSHTAAAGFRYSLSLIATFITIVVGLRSAVSVTAKCWALDDFYRLIEIIEIARLYFGCWTFVPNHPQVFERLLFFISIQCCCRLLPTADAYSNYHRTRLFFKHSKHVCFGWMNSAVADLEEAPKPWFIRDTGKQPEVVQSH